MDDRWDRIQDLYRCALERTGDERARFLREACADDDVLRRELESLLGYHSEAQLMMEKPAIDALVQDRLTNDSARLKTGQQIGSYKVVSILGAGGMGVVYRARDSRLGRDVAIKVLPPSFHSDSERVRRFEREARLLAALNHPNIAAIFGLEELSGTPNLILELVEGPTLAERITQGPLPVKEALDIAHQIAEALESAHNKGIIHRDLKPANIKLAPDGRVKVLDFGLGKTYDSQTAAQDQSNSPTITTSGTTHGVIMGTAPYMSPEQARGKSVDQCTDVWAWGCILFEMLTGRQAYPNGETVSDTLAVILGREPDWQTLPAETPPAVRRLLDRCLRKDVRSRLHPIADVRIELEEARNQQNTAAIPDLASTTAPLLSRRQLVFGLVTLFLFLAMAGITLRFVLGPAYTPLSVVRFDVFPPEGATAIGPMTLSPDGQKLAFIIDSEGKRSIWLRPLNSETAQPIPGAEWSRSGGLFWSADSRYIGFVTEKQLKKVPVSGGPVQVLWDLPIVSSLPISGSWNKGDVILLGGAGLQRVSAVAGGQATPETKLDASRKEIAHVAPHFLPDGRHYLYVAVVGDVGFPRSLALRAYVGTLDSQERYPLPGIESEVKYVPGGYLIFIRAGALMAQAFDLRRLEVTGDAFPITDRLFDSTQLPTFLLPDLFSVSTNGTLAYRAPSARELAQHPLFRPNTTLSQLTLFDRAGNPVRDVGPKDEYVSVRLSRNGKYVAFVRDGGIWVMDMEKGLANPFTTHPTPADTPVWSWDDHRIAFTTTGAFYEQPFGVVGDAKPVLQSQAAWRITDWSPDGDLIFSDAPYTAAPHVDIWALPPGDSKKPFHVTNKPFAQLAARVSTDGRWIAYLSDEPRRKLDGTGTKQRPDVYVQPFPQAGVPPKRITSDGGYMPRWSRDGKELFYVAPDSNIMSVPIRAAGSSFEAGAPMRLFKAPLDPGSLILGEVAPGTGYDVDPNGRFLINVSDGMATRKASDPKTQANSISVILNWAATLHKN